MERSRGLPEEVTQVPAEQPQRPSSEGLRLWPLTLFLAAMLCFVATDGGRHWLVQEVLGDAYDSQAEHFLRGDVGVDVNAIQHEAIIVNGQVRMYFGPFPALLRIPLNLIYPKARGVWSRISGCSASIIALAAFAGLIGEALRATSVRSAIARWTAYASIIGFACASPLLFLLGNVTIYNEAIIWGFAWSVAALYFAWRAKYRPDRCQTAALLGYSVAAGAALLSRVTFGLPFVLFTPVFFCCLRKLPRRSLVALVLPLAVAVVIHLSLSYARFGTFSGLGLNYYINPVHREFAREHGAFNLKRLPYSFADYFDMRLPRIHAKSPFLRVDRHPYDYPHLYSLPFSETYLSVTLGSAWLVLGAILGVVGLFRHAADFFQRALAAALLVQCVCILSFFALAQRYAADLYPFLIFCYFVFLRATPLRILFAPLAALVVASSGINTLATAFWLANDGNLPIETRTFWSTIARFGKN